jgi:PAS domain S-box-containing protein
MHPSGGRSRLALVHSSKAKEVLEERDAPLGQLLKKAQILVWEAEVQSWRFTYMSEQAEAMLGYPVEQWYEPNFFADHLHPADQLKVLLSCQKHSIIGDNYDLMFRLLAKDGRLVWLHSLVHVTFERGKAKRISGLMIDISEQKHAEEALIDLGGRLIAAQEKERARIARELHDDFNQRMALLSIELEQLNRAVHEHTDRQLFEKLQRQVKEISADLHRLSYRLHPSKLDHLGLGSAIQSLCAEFSESSNIKISFHKNGLPETLPKDLALTLFRVAQEGVRNCIRHSGANSVQVVLMKARAGLRLSISDNGCGFDAKSEATQGGLGFISMRERLHLVGGEMQIYSQPRRGTRLEVTVPLLRES